MNVIRAPASIGTSSGTSIATASTHELVTLGGLALHGAADSAWSAGLRRRPLALLAVLAAAGQQGVSRERLLLYFWPESDTRHARNALNQTLYAIRSGLGQEQVVAGGDVLSLSPAIVTCDLWRFERALEAGALADATALYAGPFLGDFALPGLVEFAQWADGWRDRLARRHHDALEQLAAAAEARGELELATRWWRQLAAAAPLSSAAACGVVRTLAAAGERGAALAHARRHAELVRIELGVDADPAVLALAEGLRRAPAHAGPVQPATDASMATTTVAVPERATLPVSDRPARGQRRLRRPTGLHRPALSLAAIVALLAGVADARPHARRLARPPPRAVLASSAAQRVAVLPFTVAGGGTPEAAGDAVVDLLSASLDGGVVDAVDPAAVRASLVRRGRRAPGAVAAAEAAARLRAASYVVGEIAEVGGRLRLTARWYDRTAAGEPPARAAAEGAPRDMLAVVDRLAAMLLIDRGRRSVRHALPRVLDTTVALGALKAYLVAERAVADGDYATAVDRLVDAAATDPRFVLADYGVAIAAEWMGRDSLARAAIERAAHRAGTLSAHDRLLVLALAEYRKGNLDAAERLYRELVEDYPGDGNAWFQFGELLFHGNPLRGRSATEARAAFEHAATLQPDDAEALVHLARIASIEGRGASVDSLVRRVLARRPPVAALELRAVRSFALGDPGRQRRVTDDLRRLAPGFSPVSALDVAVYRDDLDGADEFASALLRLENEPELRALGFRLRARMAAARGRWRDAAAALDSVQRHDPVSAHELRALLASLPFLRVSRETLLAVRAATEAWTPRPERAPGESHSGAHAGLHAHLRLHRLGLLGAALGDTAAALRAADSLATLPPPAGTVPYVAAALSASVRGTSALAAGHPGRALALFEQGGWPRVTPAFETEARDRFLRAEALHALGRDGEALGWYRSIAERAAYELVYLAPSELRQAEILDRRGDTDAAARLYARFVERWASADPPLQPSVAAARGRLAVLRARSGAGRR